MYVALQNIAPQSVLIASISYYQLTTVVEFGKVVKYWEFL